ncbi:MAG TPA: DUF1003 domain-containing protein [Fimbriimonadaceae bacterium]|nr:DUF1003 domain-containing protein [Fimbriimonadaceae bacterium]
MAHSHLHAPKKMSVRCQISGRDLSLDEAVPVDLIRESLMPCIRKACPNLELNGYISMAELNRARVQHAEELTQTDVDDLSQMRREVMESLQRHEILTRDVDREFDEASTIGQRIADKVADFGGSWTFIIGFGVVLVIWMTVNSMAFLAKPFDPFPFIFLNLVLSCVAAIQAPVIMMSQNRQEARDRRRGENDYKINMKAELEIQHINEKVDKLINDQWKHLLEIQQMQMEMIEELTQRSPKQEQDWTGS